MKGVRHGYGVRKSARQNKAAFCRLSNVRRSSLMSIRSEVDLSEQQEVQDLSSLNPSPPSHASSLHETEQSSTSQIGFFLKGKCSEKTPERRVSFFSRQPDSARTNELMNRDISAHNRTQPGHGNTDFLNSEKNIRVDDEDEEMIETYTGEWKNDKRSGFGVCERSDGLRYEGEWMDNCKNGYGITLFVNGTKEEGKYKKNVLLEPSKKMLLFSAKKIRERIDAAVAGALKAAQIAIQKSDIANSR